jgi:hypothetical protein
MIASDRNDGGNGDAVSAVIASYYQELRPGFLQQFLQPSLQTSKVQTFYL